MLLAYLGILVLEKVLQVENGVGLVSQPLSALMEEKLKNPIVPSGLISMKGELKHSSLDGDSSASRPIENFKNGSVKCILGHPESWLSTTAQEVLTSLQSQGKIVFTVVDEFQMNLSNHWGAEFRPFMRTVPGELRAKALKGAPLLAMSATSTKSEIGELKINLGLREANTIVLQASPIQSQHNYVKLRRPANIYGSSGLEDDERAKPGLIQLLDRIYLDEYVRSIRNGEKPKKAILFFRREDDIPDVYDELCERLPEYAHDP
jgi:superfamily II DNA helicase RecQ